MTTKPEPEYVRIKRRGAEHVARMIGKMTLEEQIEFWHRRTETLRERHDQQDKQPPSEIDWQGQPIPDRAALYDDIRGFSQTRRDD